MIKCDVVFENDMIMLGEFTIYQHSDEWEVTDGDFSEVFSTLEQAIKHCMEQSND